MKILLTGGSGQLGQALRPKLDHVGRVAAPGRDELDLARLDAIENILDAFAPELVVNAGAYTDVDGAEEAEEMAGRINGDAPGVIARWAARTGAVIIHISTDFVFDGSASRPIREDDVTNPINAYGRSKLAGETNLLMSGAHTFVLRTAWLYGPVGKNFMRDILERARDDVRLDVVSDQTGSPTTTLWLADAIVALIEQLQRLTGAQVAARAGIHHACCRGAVDRRSFAREIVARAKEATMSLACREIVGVRSADMPTAARRPAYSVLSSERLSAVWGIAAPPWRDALDEVMAQLIRRPS